MDQTLFEQFTALLESSGSFRLLSPEQQAEIRAGYTTATEEQLEKAIAALKHDKVVTANLEAERKKNAEALAQHISEIKNMLREIRRDKRVESEKKDRIAEEKEGESLLHEINAIPEKKKTDSPVKKRKKILGLF